MNNQNKQELNIMEPLLGPIKKDWPLYHQRWVRPPSVGKKEEYSGLGRGTLSNLAKRGLIKSRFIRIEQKGIHGIRVYWLPSILDYIESQPEDVAEPHYSKKLYKEKKKQ